MKTKLLVFVLLAGGSLFVQSSPAQVSFGIRIGPPPAPRMIVRRSSPGEGYTFVDGYWYPDRGRYKWHAGYWSRPPYQGAVWIAPRHDGQQYFGGYWQGNDRERAEHDHRSDRKRGRDYREDRH